MVYRHNDMQHLGELLAACPQGRRNLVITDSLFSMDGKLAVDFTALLHMYIGKDSAKS